MNWTQAFCDDCWVRRCSFKGEPGRDPTRVVREEKMKCCICGEQTSSGIFVRENPANVNYPSKDIEY